MSGTPSYNVVVFAHNEARRITRCLESILAQAGEGLQYIYVLVNGCTDDTADVVTRLSANQPEVIGVWLDRADKAASWNHYVQTLSGDADYHVFVDGDIYLADNALPALLAPLKNTSHVLATAAVPANGRSRVKWLSNMQRWGRLAGALYALRGELVNEIREEAINLPAGLIGEDFLVTCLTKGSIEYQQLFAPSKRLKVVPAAQFYFDGLRATNWRHWQAAFNRLVRYQVREHQLKLLFHYMQDKQPSQMPGEITALYSELAHLIRYQYRGRNTPIDMLAIRYIKNHS
ncbi:glycosyltransferase family 2 protein [Alteromonas oceani]|uniref:Glycosyltransferase family 2 protein n=1 Tax=Alteromonas oceani TaxID=2071609 RepID=A0ABV7JZS1_9ALTE|nr:glycosyltransferase [Alteromonas oceani]